MVEVYQPFKRMTWLVFTVYFSIQFLLPLRYLLYPDPLFWTEQGYRFSWRVMLMEKAGSGTFVVKDTQNNRTYEDNNSKYLIPIQEKMMATQPDLILQYAHYLAKIYKENGIQDPAIYANIDVTLNGRNSSPFVNPNTNLANEKWSWKHYHWILPYPKSTIK
jgi:hypothetical protein